MRFLIPFHPDGAALQFHVISPDYSSIKTSLTITLVSAFLFLRQSQEFYQISP